MQNNKNLESWIIDFYNSNAFHELYDRFFKIEAAITSTEEVIMLYGLVKKLQPKLILEIGTFFGNTTRSLAESLYENNIDGRVFTIDPFGSHRIPDILNRWPKKLKSLVDFKPWSSMECFIQLKEKHITKSNSELGLVFVDGDHDFEAALFDIISSSNYLKPSGVLVIDNLEQDGPRQAVEQFLRWNPAWKAFLNSSKNILMVNDNNFQSETLIHNEQFGILISPINLQVSRKVTKLTKTSIRESYIDSIIFNVEKITSNGILDFNLNYYACPYDYHLTGRGVIGFRKKSTIQINSTGKFIYKLSDPLIIHNTDNININYEMELMFYGNKKTDYMLLNKDIPVEFLGKF